MSSGENIISLGWVVATLISLKGHWLGSAEALRTLRRSVLYFITTLAFVGVSFGQTANTVVSDTLVNPNGSHPSGTIAIRSLRMQNDANPRQILPATTTYVTVTNGVFSVPLFPNSVALPPATCYVAAYSVGGSNFTRYWYVPVSATPVNLQAVEGLYPCNTQQGATVAPAQVVPGAAGLTQVLTSSPTGYVSWAAGGGGGGNPGGSNGQIQFNNSGAFGGFTMGGDCSITRPNIFCTKTNGVSFAPSATTDTTNATNISSGTLPPARGGTGAGQFAQNSVPFVGASGVYQQNNPTFNYDPVGFKLNLSSTGAVGGYLVIDNAAGGNQTAVVFRDATADKFQIGKQSDNSFFLRDVASARDALRVVSGNILIDPLGGDVLIGGTTDAGYRLDVQSGNNTLRVFNQSVGGTTTSQFRAGANQDATGGTDLMQFLDNSGNIMSEVGHDGQFTSSNNSGIGSSLNGRVSIGLSLSSTKGIGWSSTTSWFGTADTGLSRISAGLIGLGNGTQGDFSGSLKLANLTLTGSGFTGGGVVAVCVDNSGNMTTSGCPGGGGGGTVTHTLGPLTAGRLVIGNGSNDITVLGSSGTSTTVYHGNPGGTGSFSAVSLTADVSGILPFANGGTGTNTNFANHAFFGNSSGGTAAPVAVQPTFADLAAGTVGAAATFPGGNLFCGTVNTQTGTSYTIASSDNCKLITLNNASAIAVTLPQATTAGFTAGATFVVSVIGAGTATITPTTSTINGGSTLVLTSGQGALIKSDGTNYGAFVSAAPTGSGTVTSIVFNSPLTGGTITTSGTVGCATCVTSAAALTSNQLVIGGGLQASAALGSLGTTTTLLHGNAGGAPSFSAVNLTADVTGLLPLSNGGLNANLTASNGGIFYSTASAGAILAGTATARQMLQSGASGTPAWSTSTWPATTTINRILYSSSASVIGEISTANGGMLNASSGGVPSMTVTPVLGVAGTSTGTLGFSGVTSGVVTIQPASVAGTWSMTLPTSGGTNGFFLRTDGTGITNWAAQSFAFYQLSDFSMVKTSSTVATIGTGCSSSSPCQIKQGNVVYLLTSAPTCTISGSTASDTVYWYLSSTLTLTCGYSGAETLTASAGISAATGITSFPTGSTPLWKTTLTSNVWDAITEAMDQRSSQSNTVIVPGSGISSSSDPTTGIQTLSTDPTIVPRYFTGSGAPGINCTQGRDFYTRTDSPFTQYGCTQTNIWTAVGTSTGSAGTSVTSTTPVTVSANTTSEQFLMELAMGAGYFNSSKQPFLFNGAGVFTTPVAQTPTLTFKVKLCTVSGCGSGTVVTLVSIVTTATLASSTNNNWNFSFLGYTATTGSSGNLEIHGPLSVDLGALSTSADSIFNDINTAVSSNIDLTAALFVDFTVTTSTGSASNSITQRSGGVMPFAATAAPVTSVFSQTGAVGNLTGDVTTSGSTTTTIGNAKVAPSMMKASTFDAQTDGATITWAIGSVLNANASVTLGGNRTLNITNPVIGGNYVFKITQDGTGSRTLTLGTGCTWKVINGGAGAITLSTAAGSVDMLAFTYDGTSCFANLGKNYN